MCPRFFKFAKFKSLNYNRILNLRCVLHVMRLNRFTSVLNNVLNSIVPYEYFGHMRYFKSINIRVETHVHMPLKCYYYSDIIKILDRHRDGQTRMCVKYYYRGINASSSWFANLWQCPFYRRWLNSLFRVEYKYTGWSDILFCIDTHPSIFHQIGSRFSMVNFIIVSQTASF